MSFTKKMPVVFLFIVLSFLSKSALAQEDLADTPIRHFILYNKPVEYKPFAITGRVIGTNLESIKEAEVINICTGETTKADDNGIYHFRAAKGDTLAFVGPKYSATVMGVKSPKDKFNIILIKRKTESMPRGHSRSDYEKAKKDDDDLYKILDKDAKAEGKWNY